MQIPLRTISLATALALMASTESQAQQQPEPPIQVSRDELYQFEVLTTQNSGWLAGISLDDDANLATVYVVSDHQEEAAELARAVAAKIATKEDQATIQFKAVEHSWATLTAFKERAQENTKWFSELASSRPDMPTI